MNKKKFVLLAFGFITMGGIVPLNGNAADSRPNVVLIVADDLGYADVGFHGGKEIPTPHLDSLARSGTQFTSGYVSGPYCSPTRAGLLTGRYQQRFGYEYNPSGPGAGLPLSEKTIADRFQAEGYRTALIGKWHLGSLPEQHPQQRGFDEFYGFLGGANSFQTNEQGGVPNILRGNDPVQETRYLTDALADESVDFIDKSGKQPFFLYLAFNAVHTPMEATPERLEKFASIEDPTRRTYAGMLSALDDAVGQVVAKLKEEKIFDNTIIVFISDNGGPTMPTTTINASINSPLRGSKRQTLEGGIRVPFLISWPNTLPAGQKKDDPVIQLDLQPTLLAAAGIQATEEDQFDGVNLLSYVKGENANPPHAALFWRFGEQDAVRSGDWKLVRYGRTSEIDSNESWPKLYNLKADIGESEDLAATHPERVKELQQIWDQWNEKNIEPAWDFPRNRLGLDPATRRQD